MTALELYNPQDGFYVFRNMREADREEMLAAVGEELMQAVPQTIALNGETAWIAYTDDGYPAAVMGYTIPKPGLAVLYAFGTDRWPEVVLTLTRHGRRYVIPKFLELNVHRAECTALTSREDIRKWMGVLGAEPRTTLHQWGVNKEDFTVYSWLADVNSS